MEMKKRGETSRLFFILGTMVFRGQDRDPSLRPLFGIDRQGAAFASLNSNFRVMRDVIVMPVVGHTPPEERPEEITEIILKFFEDIGVPATSA